MQTTYDKIIAVKQHPSNQNCNTFPIEYETDTRHYAHFDCPGDPKFLKSVIASIASLDGAILVINPSEGIKEQTREHVKIARCFRVRQIVVFVNKVEEMDEDEFQLAELEIREMLRQYNYDGNSIPIVRGSAFHALQETNDGVDIGAIEKLLHAIDTYIPESPRENHKPFFMPIIGVYSINEKGTVAMGIVQRGTVKPGDEIVISGFGTIVKTVVTELETFHKQINVGIGGDCIGLLLQGLKREDIRRGQVIHAPGSVTPHKKFRVEIYVYKREENGRHTPFFTNYQPHLFFNNGSVTATVTLDEGCKMVMPGDATKISLESLKPIHIQEMYPILIRDNGKSVALGFVTQVLE